MKRETFYRCDECGKMVVEVVGGEGELCCCGKPMKVAVPNEDGAPEKHLPYCHLEGDVLSVNVGETDHPMMDVHYIAWIYVVTEMGVLAQCLNPGDAPHAEFLLGGQKPLAVFEYCTVHGLWKLEL